MFLTTTGTSVPIPELGITIAHPTTDFAILNQFSAFDIQRSTSLTSAILAGTLIWRKTAGGANQLAADYDPEYAITVALSTGGAAGDRAVTQADGDARYYLATNPSNYQTQAQVNAAIAALVASSPAALDTLNELAAALGNDPNFATTITNSLAGKANLAGGNTFTGNQTMGAALVNIPAAPLNLKNSQAGTLRTQLNLINGGGGGGAGSAIDFHTYDDQPTSTQPGARIGAIDDNFSAYLAFYTKIPGGAANGIAERMRITNTGQVGIGATPVASAKFQIDSTTQGFLQPRMTTVQRLAIAAPVEGLQVYDTDLSAVCRYSGSGWFYEFNIANTVVQTSTSTTYANLTEFVTPDLYPGKYIIEFEGTFQSSALNTGIGIRLAQGTGVINFVSINWRISQAANGTDKYFEYSQTALTDNVTSASTLAINTNYPVVGLGIFSISTAGTVALQIRSELNGSAVSIRPTSILSIRKV